MSQATTREVEDMSVAALSIARDVERSDPATPFSTLPVPRVGIQ